MFEHPTYLVLELPALVGDRVLDIRKRYDQNLAGFPAEITIAGSSGIGTLAPNQDVSVVFKYLQRLADEHLPIATSFVAISRFKTGPVIWLQPDDPTPFTALQESLIASGIQFLPHKFAYTPHCSLCTSDLTPSAAETLLHESFPQEPFELSTLTIYKVVQGLAILVKKFQPGRGTNNSFKSKPFRGSA